MNLASLPSPSTNIWYVGSVPIRAYALCILAGVLVAVYIADRRFRARGGPPGAAVDIAVWAVPAGIIGARIYHVVSSPGPYFGEGGNLVDALRIWEGGLGIWGGVAGGAVGAWIACRRRGIPLRVFADAAAPGLAVAQAIGRLGNWFNNELHGRATSLPWGLEVHKMDPDTGKAFGEKPGLYHPTFLYEALWVLAATAVVLWAERRWKLGRGRVFMLYVMLYTVGRAWIEYLRDDPATMIAGQRLNVWTSLVVFLGALVYFVVRRGPAERLEANPDWTARVLDADTAPDGGTPADADTGGDADTDAGDDADTGARADADTGAGPGDASAADAGGEPAPVGGATAEPVPAGAAADAPPAGEEPSTRATGGGKA